MQNQEMDTAYHINASDAWKQMLEKELRGKTVESFIDNGPSTSFTKAAPVYSQADTKELQGFIDKCHALNTVKHDVEFRHFCTELSGEKGNKEALQMLEDGFNAISIHANNSSEAKKLLKEVGTSYISTLIKSSGDFSEVAHEIEAPAMGGKNVVFDHCPICCTSDFKANNTVGDNGIAFLVDAAQYGEHGAAPETELLFALKMGMSYFQKMVDAGVDKATAAQQIGFKLSVGTDLYPELTKFHVLRYLWASALSEHLENPEEYPVYILAKTNALYHDTIEPYNNLLRFTLQTFIALSSPATGIISTPFTEGTDENPLLGKHANKNIPLVLQGESFLDQVAAPMSGSYFLENFGYKMADFVWEEYLQLKNQSWEDLQASGTIQNKVKDDAEVWIEKVNNKSLKLVGVNVFQQEAKEVSWSLGNSASKSSLIEIQKTVA